MKALNITRTLALTLTTLSSIIQSTTAHTYPSPPPPRLKMSSNTTSDNSTSNPQIATLLTSTSRSTNWTLTTSHPLNFSTFHPQGLAFSKTRIFMSSVEIIEATSPLPGPIPSGKPDRTVGKGIGHIFVLDRETLELQRDIQLTAGENGERYHPGGLDSLFFSQKEEENPGVSESEEKGERGKTYIYIPLSEYRPFSSASIYALDADTLEVLHLFDWVDHCGGVVASHSHIKGGKDDRVNITGSNWSSRNFTVWTSHGTVLEQWTNPDFFIDYQDGQHVGGRYAVMSGVATLPQVPGVVAQAVMGSNTSAASNSSSKYELGGLALLDLHDKGRIVHEAPVSQWSSVGHSVNRNPAKLVVENGELVMYVAPDDGDEVGGTVLLRYVAS